MCPLLECRQFFGRKRIRLSAEVAVKFCGFLLLGHALKLCTAEADESLLDPLSRAVTVKTAGELFREFPLHALKNPRENIFGGLSFL